MSEAAKYLAASVTGTLAHYGLILVLVRKFSAGAVSASTCGAITGALIIYFLNYFCTFRSQKRHLQSLSRFFVVAALGVGMNGVILRAALKYMGWHYLVAQILATATVFCLSYTINRAWTF